MIKDENKIYELANLEVSKLAGQELYEYLFGKVKIKYIYFGVRTEMPTPDVN